MRAMILAAGRGRRMGELTNDIPKPLLKIKGKSLIEYMLLYFKGAGIEDIIINVSYLGERIIKALGDGSAYGVNITYSKECEALETGGGILQALPFFQGKPFIVASGDIMTDFPLKAFMQKSKGLAHLLLVDNPPFHPRGDFGLQEGFVHEIVQPFYTFGNIGVYHPELFEGLEPGYFRLSDVLFPAIAKGLVTGEYYQGSWHNIGTKETLTFLENKLS